MEAKLKHLEFIQGVIERLAANSFSLKRWTVLLIAALLVLLSREERSLSACAGFVPVLVFWGLDGYFLWQERRFRDLYDQVRSLDKSAIDFSMRIDASGRTWRGAVFSRTLVSFYGALALFTAIAVFIT